MAGKKHHGESANHQSCSQEHLAVCVCCIMPKARHSCAEGIQLKYIKNIIWIEIMCYEKINHS